MCVCVLIYIYIYIYIDIDISIPEGTLFSKIAHFTTFCCVICRHYQLIESLWSLTLHCTFGGVVVAVAGGVSAVTVIVIIVRILSLPSARIPMLSA